MLRDTGAAGLMIGRAAQGNPWIFRELAGFLETGRVPPPPTAMLASLCAYISVGLMAW